MTTPLGPGIRVVRGPDWKWGDQDGGEGSTGTVVEVCSSTGVKTPENTVILHWDNGTRTNYRIGHQNAYDLRVIDNAQIGIRHSNNCCKSCGNTAQNVAKTGDLSQMISIFGIRWRCSSCSEVDLCTFCYMADKHDITHPFWRLDSGTESCGLLMPARKGSRKVPLKGIYPGAKIKRGHDWTWDNQDGGAGSVGKVLDIQGWDEESVRSVAKVQWLGSNNSNIYRIGHRGKVDLECIPGGAVSFGTYYPDHLPVLGRTPPVAVVVDSASQIVTPKPLNKPDENLRFSVGDKVAVNISIEVLKQIQEGHGGFNPRMIDILGKFGVVHRITNNGDIRVQYPGNPEQNFRWTLNPAALTRVTAFSPGDYVRILDSVPSLVQLQADHGEWTPEMNGAAGKIGKVIKVYGDGDIRVKVNGNTWTFNPACLRAVIGSQTQLNNTNLNEGNDAGRHQGAAALASNMPDTNQLSQDISKISLEQIVADAAAGNVEAIRKRLSSPSWKKNSRNYKVVRASLLAAAKNGHIDIVRLLVEHFPDQIDLKSAGKTCLHVAASSGHLPIVAFLLDVPSTAKIDTLDDDGDSALHYAAYGKQVEIMEYLIEKGADVNAVNATRCSVLHVSTVMSDKNAIRLLLSLPGINVNIQDKMGDTALHEAIAKEDSELIDILCNVPEIDFSLRNRRGFNAMHYAALKGNTHALKLIIAKARQLVEVKKDDGFSPLLLASLNGHSDCVRVLLDDGHASFDVIDNRGQTALHTAVHQGHAAVIEVLISRLDSSTMKRLINKEDFDGETSLHIALSREGDPPVPLSVESSPLTHSIAIKVDKFGVSKRLVHAVAVAALLVKNGGKLYVKNQRGNSPISLVLDAMAKTFLLDIVQQQASPKQTSLQKSSSESSSSKPRSPEPVASVAECRICCEQNTCVTFQPCGHSIVCLDCSKRVKKCLDCGILITNKLNPQGEVLSRSQHLIHALEAKVQEMEEKFTCSICMERNREVAFLCGHSTCRVCSDDLDYCHMCRRRVQQKITLY